MPNHKISSDLIGKNIVNLIEYVSKDLSKSEIRRLIKNNGIKIDNEKIENEQFEINQKIFEKKGFIKIVCW